jgi:parallel beta-helix repeat protein
LSMARAEPRPYVAADAEHLRLGGSVDPGSDMVAMFHGEQVAKPTPLNDGGEMSMFKSKRALLGALVLGVAISGVATVPAMAAPATLTVGNPATCPGATYPTINSAVVAASPGDTIKVCAGNYPENVLVTKQLTFLGAQAGKDARVRNNPSKESVVNNVAGDFTLTGAANKVKIDGFTISGAGADPLGPNAVGISAFQGTSGLVVLNNVITGNREGMNYQNPDGSMPSLVQRNAFKNNSAGNAGPNSGTGVFISNGPANNTTISDNSFTGHTETAINFAGNPASLSVGLSVNRNVSVDDATFVVATDSNGAVVSQNLVYVQASSDNGSGILDFGSNQNLSIDSNVIYGGSAAGTSGIRLGNFSGTASTNTKVTNNQVYNRFNGVRLTGTVGATVSDNNVSGSTNDGILMESGSNNSFLRNSVEASTVHDCEDRTTGTGTAGTANTWTGNSGKSNNSSPPTICPKKGKSGGDGGHGGGGGDDGGHGGGNDD